MDQLVQFSPVAITFEFTPGRQTVTYLHLRNVSEYRVAYKVKTTHIRRYCVRPNAAVIEPGAEINVELTQQALKALPDDISHCRDRFLLQVARIDLVPSGNAGGPFRGYESVMELWTAVPEAITHKAKFSVTLRMLDKSREGSMELNTANTANSSSTPRKSPARPTKRDGVQVQPLPAPLLPTESSKGNIPPMAQDVSSEINLPFVHRPRSLQEQGQQKHVTPSPTNQPLIPTSSGMPSCSSTESTTIPGPNNVMGPDHISAESSDNIDYTSIEYARERALAIRTAPKIPLRGLDKTTRQRIAVERAGELVRTINERQKDIDMVNRDLSEARHRLSDARMATRPAYDVRYEVNESARVPYAQIAIMAIISGALLQLLV